MEDAPLKNVTVPVAVAGETVAVNVTVVPSTGVVVDAVSEVVLAVVPVEVEPEPPLGAFQKSPQPVANPISSGAVSSAAIIR